MPLPCNRRVARRQCRRHDPLRQLRGANGVAPGLEPAHLELRSPHRRFALSASCWNLAQFIQRFQSRLLSKLRSQIGAGDALSPRLDAGGLPPSTGRNNASSFTVLVSRCPSQNGPADGSQRRSPTWNRRRSAARNDVGRSRVTARDDARSFHRLGSTTAGLQLGRRLLLTRNDADLRTPRLLAPTSAASRSSSRGVAGSTELSDRCSRNAETAPRVRILVEQRSPIALCPRAPSLARAPTAASTTSPKGCRLRQDHTAV
jgi:hypothetical protein